MQLGELLVEDGLVEKAGLYAALDCQRRRGGHLGTNLLEQGLVEEQELLTALGRQRSTPVVDAHDLENIPRDVVDLLPREIAARYGVIPFRRRGDLVYLASMLPGDAGVEREIAELTSCLPRTYIGLELRVREALDRYYGVTREPRLVRLAENLPRHGTAAATTATEGASETTSPLDFDRLRLESLFNRNRAKPADEPDINTQPLPPLRLELVHSPSTPQPRLPPSGSAAAGTGPSESRRAASATLPAVAGPAAEGAVPVAETTLPFLKLEPLSEEPAEETTFDTAVTTLLLPRERLRRVTRKLRRPENRDQVIDLLMGFVGPYFERRLLLVHRQGFLIGWRGEGEGIDAAALSRLAIGDTEASVFFSLSKGARFWLGPLPELPSHRRLMPVLTGTAPSECIVLPIPVRDRVVGYFYADNYVAGGVHQGPLAELRRLVRKIGLALEVCVLRQKIASD